MPSKVSIYLSNAKGVIVKIAGAGVLNELWAGSRLAHWALVQFGPWGRINPFGLGAHGPGTGSGCGECGRYRTKLQFYCEPLRDSRHLPHVC